MECGGQCTEDMGGTHVAGESSADSWDFKIQVHSLFLHMSCGYRRITHKHAAVFIYADNTFGAGSGPVLIEDISCIGTEASLFQCSNYNSNYNDRSSAALRCENYPTNQGKCL